MIFLVIAAGAVLFLMSQKTSEGDDLDQRIFNLEDISPLDQGGSYKRDYDAFFEKSADDHQVPFALIKAHAIAESSLNPRAFRDENPTKRNDRQGWASRGLCQLLFWPGSKRFEQFGYSDKDLAGGELLFDPEINADIAAQLIRANLIACSGNIRDAINMYNTGVKESKRQAPHNYVDKVMNYYNKIIKKG